RLVDLKNFDPEVLHIFSRTVLSKIQNNEEGWEEMLPEGVSETIKEKRLFGCSKKRVR
ncbi:MAG TPA: nicotinate-nucleotide adenylyltransferase, partial [Tenacibaculum sp.]|nr:nicotinate-nucleotide adenylyltransferase [Tenacibaculum sp.]